MTALRLLTDEEDAARIALAVEAGVEQALQRLGCTPLQPLLGVEEVNRLFGLAPDNRSSVYELVRLQRLPALRVSGKLRFRPEDVRAYIQAQAEKGGKQ